MRSFKLFIVIIYSSLCFGQSGTDIRRCIDVIKSGDGKYYAIYSDNTWEESTYTMAEVIKAINNKNTPPAKTASEANNKYGIVNSSPTKPTSSSSKGSSSSRSFQSSKTSNTRKSTSRAYIQGPRGGCYYINSNGGKTYVDRSMCK